MAHPKGKKSFIIVFSKWVSLVETRDHHHPFSFAFQKTKQKLERKVDDIFRDGSNCLYDSPAFCWHYSPCRVSEMQSAVKVKQKKRLECVRETGINAAFYIKMFIWNLKFQHKFRWMNFVISIKLKIIGIERMLEGRTVP